MPIFEHKCNVCGQITEFIVLAGTDTEIVCKCGSKDLRKLISRVCILKPRLSESKWEDDVITQRGADPTKEYETIHDVPVGELKESVC